MFCIQLVDATHPTQSEGVTTANCNAVYVLPSFGRVQDWRCQGRLARLSTQSEFRNE